MSPSYSLLFLTLFQRFFHIHIKMRLNVIYLLIVKCLSLIGNFIFQFSISQKLDLPRSNSSDSGPETSKRKFKYKSTEYWKLISPAFTFQYSFWASQRFHHLKSKKESRLKKGSESEDLPRVNSGIFWGILSFKSVFGE